MFVIRIGDVCRRGTEKQRTVVEIIRSKHGARYDAIVYVRPNGERGSVNRPAWCAALRRAAAAPPPRFGVWTPVTSAVPQCDPRPNSFGVPVLVWPNLRTQHTVREAEIIQPYAFYGRRCSDEPEFYFAGCVLDDVTHWMPLPEGPTK